MVGGLLKGVSCLVFEFVFCDVWPWYCEFVLFWVAAVWVFDVGGLLMYVHVRGF